MSELEFSLLLCERIGCFWRNLHQRHKNPNFPGSNTLRVKIFRMKCAKHDKPKKHAFSSHDIAKKKMLSKGKPSP